MHDHHGAGGTDLLLALFGNGLPSWSVVAAGLFITALAGGFVHCGGMCGPFVLAQVGRGLTPGTVVPAGLARLSGGLLLPYHAGRVTTYTLLGAVSGGLSASIAGIPGLRWVPVAALALSALFFLWLAAGRLLPLAGVSGFAIGADRIAGLAAPLLDRRSAGGSYLLGLTLGLLPCGMVYGALAAAAGAGNVLTGALAMLAFGLGTMPALLVVGTAGAAAMRGFRHRFRLALPPLFLLNAAVLGALAWGAAG
jgi:sulfite exporter TauE/SafE